ncbi:hypothetical protein BKA66DRAFT_319533 [Pyrenochaeta sp. MPI-SDFR-AT-0127]|nr:hypothetical protein BKA66DRAFT_319533 [Pyrenochaeta sp. MPI-SDFR-AT-0127]
MHDDSDDPESVLTYMDTAFSKWSHAKREGIDAITGIVMGAPPETHTTLAHWDKASCQKASRHFSQMITADNRELLSPDNLAAQTNPGDRAYVTLLHNSLPHRNDSRAATQKVLCSDTVVINDFSSSAEHPTQKQQYGSKRAALIAKDKAISKNTVLVAQSASQKRSAQQKKKNRKSTMPPPSSIKRSKQECKSKTEQHSETEQHQHQSGSTLLIYNDTEDGRRDAITLALKAGIIDPNKINHSDALYQMMALGDAKSPTESNKQIVKRHAEERGIGLRGVSHDEHRKKRQNVQDTNN